MKQVNALAILGNPNRIDQQVACPNCHERAMAFEDGSILCIMENLCFAPEPGKDAEMHALRVAFDERKGITAADRAEQPS